MRAVSPFSPLDVVARWELSTSTVIGATSLAILVNQPNSFYFSYSQQESIFSRNDVNVMGQTIYTNKPPKENLMCGKDLHFFRLTTYLIGSLP